MTIHALSCGINYFEDPQNQLRGCINDMLDMRDLFLKSGVREENLTLLSDDPNRNDIKPTKANILAELVKKGKAAKPGDTLIFHYSGHGTYSRDYDNDEADKRDEAICPINNGNIENISDDELYAVLRKLPKDIKAFVIMDCCHSASDLDLANSLNKIESKRKPDNSHGYVVEISGCQDNQTSADAFLRDIGAKSKIKREQISNRELIERNTTGPRYRGALTAAFLNTVDRRKGLQAILDTCFSTSKTLMQGLRDDILGWLKANHFSQVPSISYEGAAPNSLVARGEPIIHGYKVGNSGRTLRQTAARSHKGYEAVEQLQVHARRKAH